MARYSNDPRWVTARFDSECTGCRKTIRRGQPAFYYPRTRDVLCDRDDCGGQASRDFEAAAFDEAQMTGSW